MGADLLQDAEVSALCDRCESFADVELRRLLPTADGDELRLRRDAHAAMYFDGIRATARLRRHGTGADAAAGHPVGEYAALAAGGAFDAPHVIKALVERGHAMA